MTALRFENFSLSIGDTPILNSIDLSVAPGEILGLVGRSGSGKSITALSAMGLSPTHAKQSGSIFLGDAAAPQHDASAWRKLRGRDVAMVFQEPMTALNPLQTISAQVKEAIVVHRTLSDDDAEKEAGDILARVGLGPDIVSPQRYPHEISGGQRQRVIIAIAIANAPSVIIADEPTTALDVTTQAEIVSLLQSLAREKKIALLFISHDLALISQIADRVAVIFDGKIVETAPTRDFFESGLKESSNGLVAERIEIRKPAPSENTPTVLDVERLVCVYADAARFPFGSTAVRRAVNDVSLRVRKGETVALVGESGCGKSTLARAIVGLHHPLSGTIKIDGRVRSAGGKISRSDHRRAQIVFQDPYSSFNPRWRISEILSEPLHLFTERPTPGERRRLIAEALCDVDLLSTDAEKYPHELSGGQRQRVAIARALMVNPALLILDEATSALDITSRNRILKLLMALQDRHGVSYLLITHDLSVVRDVATHTLIMKSGKIIERGETSDVIGKPSEDYTKSLIAAAPQFPWQMTAPNH